MRDVQPKDIPESGKRYDMTLKAVGFRKPKYKGQPMEERDVIAKFVIDNGPYRGKDVSTVLQINQGEKRDAVAGLQKRTKTLRRSAVVHVQLDVTEVGHYYRYHLTDFEQPKGETQLRLVRKETKFTR